MAEKKTKTKAESQKPDKPKKLDKPEKTAKASKKDAGDGLSLKTKRSIAKSGMVASLATLTVTGAAEAFGGQVPRTSKTLHVWSGFALVGFSLWHYMLYKPATGKD